MKAVVKTETGFDHMQYTDILHQIILMILMMISKMTSRTILKTTSKMKMTSNYQN